MCILIWFVWRDVKWSRHAPIRIISICFSQIKGPLVPPDRSCQTLTETLGRECLSEYSHTVLQFHQAVSLPSSSMQKKLGHCFRQKTFLKKNQPLFESNSHILKFIKVSILFIKTSGTLPSLQSLSQQT